MEIDKLLKEYYTSDSKVTQLRLNLYVRPIAYIVRGIS